MKPFDSSRFCP